GWRARWPTWPARARLSVRCTSAWPWACGPTLYWGRRYERAGGERINVLAPAGGVRCRVGRPSPHGPGPAGPPADPLAGRGSLGEDGARPGRGGAGMDWHRA